MFREKTVMLLKKNIIDLNVKLEKRHDRLFLDINDVEESAIKERLMRVSGLGSFSFVVTAEPDFKVLAVKAVELIRKEIKTPTTFKIETKRVDKSLPQTSQEISQLLSRDILRETADVLSVDVKNP